MKTKFKYTFLVILLINISYSCKKDNTDAPEDPFKNANKVDVKVVLPEGSSVDLTDAVIFSLGFSSDLSSSQTGKLPYNTGSVELACLLDKENNVLLAGFVDENHKDISIETTTEVMLYYALDYYLLPDNAKKAFLSNVKQVPDFSGFVSIISGLFKADPLMYTKGTYLPKLNEKINQISAQQSSAQIKRVLIHGEPTKSGITVSKIDSAHIKLQNSYPRRTRVFIYKQSFFDRNGNFSEITNYTSNPIANFDIEPGKKPNIETMDVGSRVAQVNAQSSSIDNASSTDQIELPINKSTEFLAEYEVVVIGPGKKNLVDRDMTDMEKKAYEEINEKTYALDYLLPIILDIGGNKGLLPPYGSDKENALLDAVLPVLDANPDVLDDVKSYDFKSATETLLPVLYGDIRLSNELRTLLTNVYNILSNNGTMPNTFVQSQELIETGYARNQVVMTAISKNMNFDDMFRDKAKSLESWLIDAIDANVTLSPKTADVCLGDAINITVSYFTYTDPDTEDLEIHWSTSNKFGGRIQDINGDPNNFGASIITTNHVVSYISTASESALGGGDNIETVTATIYAKDKKTGELSKVGQDAMTINNKKGCASFYVSFTKEVKINIHENSLLCHGDGEYFVGHPTFVAQFEAVDGARSYTGKVLKKDGTHGNEFALSNLEDLGNGILKFTLGVGPIVLYSTCDADEANAEQKKRLDYLDEVGHQGIEITPVF